MSRSLSFPPDSEILTWARPDRKLVPVKHQAAYDKRVAALEAVIKGTSVLAAASLHKIDRATITAMAEGAQLLAEDGKPNGFRVCLPWSRHRSPAPKAAIVPLAAGPHAFNQLLAAVPAAMALLGHYKGGLPSHNARCPAFDDLFRRFRKLLRDQNLAHAYPLNQPDSGRRAVTMWLRSQRKRALDAGMLVPAEDSPAATRLDQLFKLRPLDRAEFDEHITDVKWHALVPTPDGLWTVVEISGIWILLLVDAAAPIIYAWNLVVGRACNQFDLLRTQAKSLTPWAPRRLIVPDLRYHPEAWMPGLVEDASQVPRPASVALDNAMSHVAKWASESLGDNQLGIANLGYPHVPEGRAHVESMFKRLEEAIIRLLAGGFRPAKQRDETDQPVSQLSPSDHPVDIEALEDLIDVHISGFHSTTLPEWQNRTPRQLFEAHLANGLWMTQSTLTAQDSDELLAIRSFVMIRGSKKKGKLPHVRYKGARYRSPKLNARYDLIGTRLRAKVRFSEGQTMTLFDQNGNVFAVLHAVAPWHMHHSLEERNRAMHWKQRGVLSIPAGSDGVAAYHACVRELASQLQWAADLFVKGHAGHAKDHAALHRSRKTGYQPADTPAAIAPRGGYVGLTSRSKK